MRLSRLRLTVRGMMVVVAIVAVVVWSTLTGLQLWKRSRQYREEAARFATMQRWAEDEASRKEQRIARWRDRPEDSRQERWAMELARAREQAAYCSGLFRKYNRLASYPWETIAPDPPPWAGFPTAPPPGTPGSPGKGGQSRLWGRAEQCRMQTRRTQSVLTASAPSSCSSPCWSSRGQR